MGTLFAKIFNNQNKSLCDDKTIVDPDQPEVSLVLMELPVDITEGQGFFIRDITQRDDGSKVLRIEHTECLYAMV